MTLSEIAALVDGTVIGNQHTIVNGLASIDNITPEALVLAIDAQSLQLVEQSDAAAILVGNKIESEKKPLIRVPHVYKAFAQLLTYFYPSHRPEPGIHPTAIIAPDAILGKQVSIGPYVTIAAHSQIGDNCVIHSHVSVGRQVCVGASTELYPHVTLYDNCRIGQNVIIHANTVVGCDGFGYKFIDGHHMKIPHVGNVIITDNVEIGANTVIDRASMGSTVIGKGTKIDNLVQVAHSVKLGKHNILCAFTGIAGSTTSGDHVVFAANVGVSDHVTIDDNVILGARTGVPPKKHLLKGLTYLGNPARPIEKAMEQEFASTRIPFMRKNIQALLEQVKELNARLTLLEQSDDQ